MPVIVLAGIMIAASLIASSPAAAAKAHASVFGFCISNGPQTTPGYPLQCAAGVGGFPAPTGTLKLAASSYKGTLSTNTCSSISSCNFTYTPIGKGTEYRKDTIYVRYSGDDNYYSGTAKITIFVKPSPTPGLVLSCPESAVTGTEVPCDLQFQMHGPFVSNQHIDLKVATYKGTIVPTQCSTLFTNHCRVYYTPKGRGYDTRLDTITASFAGDLYNSPEKVTDKINVTAAP